MLHVVKSLATHRRSAAALALAGALLGATSVHANQELPFTTPTRTEPALGRISFYGPGLEGRPTANGETFSANALTMAHRTLPFGSRVRITNLRNRKSIEVRVNDRGPFVRSRIADVSVRAARELGMVSGGLALVRIDLVDGQGALRLQ